MIGLFFQETNTKKHHIVRYSAIKPLDNSLLLFQGTVAMGSTFLFPLPYYLFLLPTRPDLSGSNQSLQTPLHGQVGLGAPPPAQHHLSSLSPLAPHSSPASLLLGGVRTSVKEGRGGAARLIPQPLCTFSLQRDCRESSGPHLQKGQGEDKLRWDWLVKS